MIGSRQARWHGGLPSSRGSIWERWKDQARAAASSRRMSARRLRSPRPLPLPLRNLRPIPGGLITPIIFEADTKPLSRIATEMKDLAARARDHKLLPSEYQGGTASISNMGMYGIRQFDAVINPPQGMIMAIGAGEKRPYVINDSLQIATVMSATGSFDHRAIDGADGARLMAAFKRLIENPPAMLA